MKSFIIRLVDNDWSLTMSDECIKESKKYNLDVQPFDGVNGIEAEVIFQKDNIKKFPRGLKKDTLGVKGCAASHYLLWKTCAEDNMPYLILEHDAFMIRPLPSDVLNKFTDVLKLDSSNPFIASYDNDVKKDNGNAIVNYNLNWGYKKKTAPYGGYFLGAWAYIIKPHAARILINQMKLNGWVPTDKQFGETVLKLESTASTIFRIHKKYNHSNIHDLSLTRK